MSEATAPPAQVGPYRLGEQIGRGGMGCVHRCTASRDGVVREFAIKLLPALRLADEREVRLFLRECTTLERFRHPNILTLHDYGVENGLPYLVTELCADRNGRPFSLGVMQHRDPGLRLDPSMLNRVFPQVCAALAYIHGLGMVHCDIKPENVLLSEENSGRLLAKVGDFGLAGVTVDQAYVWRQVWHRDDAATADGTGNATAGMAFSGTYDYMSPEQLAGDPLDARSDVYSLGVMLYRLATGYDRVTFLAPSRVVPELPEWVDTVVTRSVVEAKAERCENALELLFLLPCELRPDRLERHD